MKLTTERLRQLIKEEINRINESTIQQKLASYKEVPIQIAKDTLEKDGYYGPPKHGFQFITPEPMYLKQIIDEMIRERLLKLDGEFSIQNKELFYKPSNHGKYKDFKDLRQTIKNFLSSLENAGLKVRPLYK